MTTLKKGNIFAHAKAGKKIIFQASPKVKAVRANPAKRAVKQTVAKKAAPPKKQFKYCLQYKKLESHPFWQTVAGANDLEAVKVLAKRYAKSYPSYYFQVV
jgi:hypothetical protein